MCILFLLTHWKTCFKDAVFYIMVDPCNPLHNFIVFFIPSIVGFQFCLMKHQCPVFIIYRSHCKLPELVESMVMKKVKIKIYFTPRPMEPEFYKYTCTDLIR